MSAAKRREGASNCSVVESHFQQNFKYGQKYGFKCSEVGGQLLESIQENNVERTRAEEQSSHSPHCLVEMK